MKIFQPMKHAIQKSIWSFFWNNFQLPQIAIDDLCPVSIQEFPLITKELCIPPYKGDKTLRDFSFLISLVRHRNPKIVLEFGTAYGTTVANICAVCNARVYTVNALAEQIEGNLITYLLMKDEIGYVYRENGYADRVVQIYENTRNIKILDWIDPKSVDFAIIDACHDSEFIVNDFLKILPALSDKAIVLFHDTSPSFENNLIDSYIGCMYLRKIGFNVKHLRKSSWGIWVSNNPSCKISILNKVNNVAHTLIGFLLFGNQEKYIQELRWFASIYLRGRFNHTEIV
jgi:hypothetical protein